MKSVIFFLLLSLVIGGCRAHLSYINDYPMSRTTFVTNDGIIHGSVPVGWFVSHEDTLVPTLTAWLVKDDFSASISFRELSVDPPTSRDIQKKGLELLAQLSIKFHETPGIILFPIPHPTNFELMNNRFCEYEIGGQDSRTRVVVFTTHGRYYECEARSAKGGWSENDLNQLFRIQQSVVASLSL